LGARVDVRKAVKAINNIRRHDVPLSTFYARRTGVRKAMTDGRKAVIGSLDRKVSLKYLPIKRPGQKKTNARFIGYFGDKKKDIAWIKFNSNHINPAGTNKYPNVGKQTRRKKKTKVRGIGGTYDDAFMIKTRRGAKSSPQVFNRDSAGRLNQVVIELGPKAERVFQASASRSFAAAYEKELQRQIKRRVSRRVAR